MILEPIGNIAPEASSGLGRVRMLLLLSLNCLQREPDV